MQVWGGRVVGRKSYLKAGPNTGAATECAVGSFSHGTNNASAAS